MLQNIKDKLSELLRHLLRLRLATFIFHNIINKMLVHNYCTISVNTENNLIYDKCILTFTPYSTYFSMTVSWNTCQTHI